MEIWKAPLEAKINIAKRDGIFYLSDKVAVITVECLKVIEQAVGILTVYNLGKDMNEINIIISQLANDDLSFIR